LVLPMPTREALEEIAFEAAARLQLLSEPEPGRLYARGGGLAALFCGPPGTGKTMAAEVIADALGADLLIVDLAATMSKYIGETAKNLTRVFDEAVASNAILLFDEADALFAKRSEIKDAHDRHANADTNHLLQLLEGFDGLAILATNRRANMDPAFVRRIRHIVEFARPGVAERRVIWRRALAALAGEEHAASLGSLLDGIADQHDLTAAQIKNAALTVRYAAMREGGPITEAQIRRGLGRELIKDGRPLDAPRRAARNRYD
jgi:SpoVK/Ycf46/Vps4 family AAA+-type ATPase